MKKRFLKIFNSESEYLTLKDEVMKMPYVVYLKDSKSVKYSGKLPSVVDYSKEYFTIEALENELTVTLSRNASEYCIDNGEWITLSANTTSPSINSGQTISFRMENPTISPTYGIGTFNISKKFNVKGNIMSLLYAEDFEGQTDLSGMNYTFYKLFYNCINLVNAENLVLPATTLATSCYSNMFNGCTSLTTAPELPATTLANYCYSSMFNGCTSLTTAPELKATTLTSGCYSYMFQGCTSLTTALELKATTLANKCCYYTFQGCTSLTTTPELLATTLADSCYSAMFSGCTSLTTTPELLATTLADSCYSNMFQGCTSLTTALELPATTLAQSCYYYMFQGCTSLTTAPELKATTLAQSCYSNMFQGCTSLTTAPELKATTLANYCYYSMFGGCTSLTTAPELKATTLANYCYYYMFQGCTSLTTAPELKATTLAKDCYQSMFQNCTSLTTAPELPATTLASYCYQYMFQGCSKLNYIKMLATNISASYCLDNWVKGVASSGTFVKNLNMTSLPKGLNGIPNGWTVENTFNNISPCIINQDSESITFVYSDGLFTPTNKIIDLSQHFTKDELLSVQPECEIIVTLLDKTDNVLASDYVWANDKTLGDVLNELGVTKDVYDINVIIINVNAPEDNGYYYYYMLDETEPTEPFVEKDWMRIVSLEDNNTISLPTNTSPNLMYSLDGIDWIQWDYSTITLGKDDILYLKGNNSSGFSTSSSKYNRFDIIGKVELGGNIMSLVYGDDFENNNTLLGTYTFYRLFYNCAGIISAKNLVLPATTLATSCYYSMFYGCTSLTIAPELPATTLAQNCYTYMFGGCTSLTTAPELKATTLADSCYYSMFGGCTSLTTAPELLATTLANECYYSMFANTNVLPDCSNIDFTSKSVVASGGLKGLFAGTKVTDSDLMQILPLNDEGKYCLPATTLAQSCYSRMFQNCTSLTTAPELPATTLASYCYQYMFQGCSKLNYIKMLATNIIATFCLNNWVKDVASNGTFVKNANMTSLPNGVSGIPNGWTVETV